MLSFKHLSVLHKSLLLLFIAFCVFLSAQDTSSGTIQPPSISHQIRSLLEMWKCLHSWLEVSPTSPMLGEDSECHTSTALVTMGRWRKYKMWTLWWWWQSCKGHRFSAALHGEAGGAHEEGRHGPHQRGWKGFTFLHFFFLFFPLLLLPSLFSRAPLLYISTDQWHVFSLDSYCIGGTEKMIFAPTRKERVQDSMPPCNLAQK